MIVDTESTRLRIFEPQLLLLLLLKRMSFNLGKPFRIAGVFEGAELSPDADDHRAPVWVNMWCFGLLYRERDPGVAIFVWANAIDLR